ncbi:MAG: choice-of-anchor T family protein [Thermoplasmatota archaeon]
MTFLLIFWIMIPLGNAVSGIETPSQIIDLVIMEIDEERIEVDISFNGTSTGQLHCRATLMYDMGLLIEYVDLHIEPEFPPEHISVVLEEYDVRLTPSSPVYEFIANITVLPKTSSSLNPSVIIGGTARTDRGTEGEVREDSCEIDVLPYYSVTIFFLDPTGDMDIGSSKTFPLTMQNTGNSGEHFILAVKNRDFLVKEGIEVTFSESRVYVDEGGVKEVDVKVRVAGGSERGSYLVEIYVWSERNGRPTEEDNEASLTLNVDRPYIDLVEKFVKDPIYLWIGLGILVVLVVLAIWGLIKLREHLLWKRTLENIRNANSAEESKGPGDRR